MCTLHNGLTVRNILFLLFSFVERHIVNLLFLHLYFEYVLSIASTKIHFVKGLYVGFGWKQL
jgi:hypothetical protein